MAKEAPRKYRITATRVLATGAPGTWMLHLEDREARPGFRSVAWRYARELGDLREAGAELLGTPHPALTDLEIRFVLPPEVSSHIERAAHLIAAGSSGKLIDRVLDGVRRGLVELGLSDAEIAMVLSVVDRRVGP